MTESDIFELFERLVEIEVPGEKYQFSENNTLLRCFQYLSWKPSLAALFAGTAIVLIVRFGCKKILPFLIVCHFYTLDSHNLNDLLSFLEI
jgi:hypothetical protein